MQKRDGCERSADRVVRMISRGFGAGEPIDREDVTEHSPQDYHEHEPSSDEETMPRETDEDREKEKDLLKEEDERERRRKSQPGTPRFQEERGRQFSLISPSHSSRRSTRLGNSRLEAREEGRSSREVQGRTDSSAPLRTSKIPHDDPLLFPFLPRRRVQLPDRAS